MKTTNTLAWYGEPALHQSVLDRVRNHAAAGRIAQGEYWLHGQGCFLGCCTHGEGAAPRFETKHDLLAAMDRELGIPHALAQHLEHLFECAPKEIAAETAVCLVEAIAPGIDSTQLVQRARELEQSNNTTPDQKFWAFLTAAQEQTQANPSTQPVIPAKAEIHSLTR